MQQHALDPDESQPTVLVGRDTRISSPLIEAALTAGLLSVGIHVMQLGVIPTPGVAYLTRTQGVLAGIMISASHNPVQDNGIKFFGPDGFKLSDDQEAEIERLLLEDRDQLPRPSDRGLGVLEEFPEGKTKYTQYLISLVDDLSGIQVYVDAANGATAPLVNQLFADLDTDFITMGDRPDGLNINEGVGSTHPEALQEAIKSREGFIGIAFDGDGDRMLAVDEAGRLVDGDKILYICGHHLMKQGQLKHSTLVSTVMSNLGFYKALEAVGMEAVKAQVGDRFVVEAMRAGDYTLGGEQSGHIVFLDYNTTGDGMLTAIQLLSIMKETGKSLQELAEPVELFPQKLVNIPVQDKYTVLDEAPVQAVIQEVEAEMAGQGRVLVRPSGTEPVLRIMAEAETPEKVAYYVDKIAQVVQELRGTEKAGQ